MSVIPPRELSTDALFGVIEEFINREGTDYGEFELSLNQKVQRLLDQIQRGKAYVVFDPDLESTSILSRQQVLEAGVDLELINFQGDAING